VGLILLTQWGLCVVPGVIGLILGELFKVVLRARGPEDALATAVGSATAVA
jgi:hypothetical protein